jgi:hypothetical protein
MQMIGIGQDYLGAEPEYVTMGDPFNRTASPDRGKRRCPHEAVRCAKLTGSSDAVAMSHSKRE